MKKMLVLMTVVMTLACASWCMAFDRPANLAPASEPPAGFKLNIATSGAMATVSVVVPAGMEIYKNHLEVYGGEKIEYAAFNNGAVTTPIKRWYNLIFKTEKRPWTYLLVIPEYAALSPAWFGEGVGVMPDFGKGCSLTHRLWLKASYK